MKEPELKDHQIMNEVRDLSEVLTTLPRLQDFGKVSGPSLSPIPPLICKNLHPKLLLLCLTHSPGAAHENPGDRVSRGLLRTVEQQNMSLMLYIPLSNPLQKGGMLGVKDWWGPGRAGLIVSSTPTPARVNLFLCEFPRESSGLWSS